ncbi:glycosyltransferase [Bacillaceae bacterium]
MKIPYLPLSETFIYERIKNIKGFSGYVLTDRKIRNRHLFPYRPIYHLRRIRNVPRFLRRKKTALIHAYFGRAGIRMLPHKRRAKIPMVTSFHGVDVSARVRNKRYRARLRKLFRHGELFFTVSRRMKRKLIRLGCPARKIRVVKTGIDLKKFPFKYRKPPKRKKLRILSVGRLIPKKGMDDLIRAFAIVHKKYPNTELVIVGDGKKKKKLKKLIRKLGLSQAVKLKGEMTHNEVRKEYRRAHLFCLASKTGPDGDQEGIPNALVEAMASGLPVVATRHSGIPELVIHKKTGLLAEPGNAKDLADKIKKLLKKPHLWRKFAKKARERVKKHHQIHKQVRKAETYYRNLIRRKKQK